MKNQLSFRYRGSKITISSDSDSLNDFNNFLFDLLDGLQAQISVCERIGYASAYNHYKSLHDTIYNALVQ